MKTMKKFNFNFKYISDCCGFNRRKVNLHHVNGGIVAMFVLAYLQFSCFYFAFFFSDFISLIYFP